MREALDSLIEPVLKIYREIELDLLLEIAKQFDVYDTIGGTMEWQIQKLDELGGLNAKAVRVFEKWSGKTQDAILNMLGSAGYSNINTVLLEKAFQAEIFSVSPEKILKSAVLRSVIRDSYREVNQTFRLIRTKAIESVRQSYMTVLNTAYIETSSGIYDYNTSIRKALRSMAAKGITGATYQRGNRVIQYSLEGTVRRDTLTAVHQLANRGVAIAAEEGGAEYVEISKHIGARVSNVNPIANHAGWQGKVFKLHGFDQEYGNLKTNTGYPDDIQGLGGVNCRHRMFLFFPGLSVPTQYEVDEKENERVYHLTQKQRRKEREIRVLKKQLEVARASGDTVSVLFLRKKLKEKSAELEQFCKKNGLKRDWNREIITAEA